MPELELPRIDRVSLRRRAGRGGMADVYYGIHETLQRPVAVKILHSHLVEDQDVRRRFHAEAQAVSGLRHPNIVQVYDFGLLDGRPYIIMEFIDGPSLAGLLQARRGSERVVPMMQFVELVVQVASALDYAHARRIVHRDVKPANILLRSPDPDGVLTHNEDGLLEAVLSDFGVARFAQSTAATLSGTILGTPAYMGPEQVMGGAIDARTDIYSLGVVLYEMLTGELPFHAPAETPAAMLFQHVHESPPPLPDGISQLQVVIDRALAKDPGERYLTAGDLADQLRHQLSGGLALATGVQRDRATRGPSLRSAQAVSRTALPRSTRLAIFGLFTLLLLAGGAFSLPRLLPGLVAGQGGAQATSTPGVGSTPTQVNTAIATQPGEGSAGGPTSGASIQGSPEPSRVSPSPTLEPGNTSNPSRTPSPRPSAAAAPTSTHQPGPTPTDLLDILTPASTLLDL